MHIPVYLKCQKSDKEKQKLEQTRITLDEVKRTLIADLKDLMKMIMSV